MHSDDVFAVGMVAMVIALVIAAMLSVAFSVAESLTDAECKRARYTGGAVTMTWERYCVTRRDQTDIVVPLAEVRRAGSTR